MEEMRFTCRDEMPRHLSRAAWVANHADTDERILLSVRSSTRSFRAGVGIMWINVGYYEAISYQDAAEKSFTARSCGVVRR